MPAAKRPVQKALPLAKDAPALQVAPQPLYDGGPKEPVQGQHQDFHFLSWAFHKARFERLGDLFFDPWDGKHLKACKGIMTRARGDRGEVRRRLNNLWLWHQHDQDFYKFTPQTLLGKWDDMHTPPTSAIGGRHALRKQAEAAGQSNAKRHIMEKYGHGRPGS